MKIKLLNKLSNCLSLVIAFIVTAMIYSANANAQIVYTNIIPDTTINTNGGVYALDLNNDGITDFNITYTTSGSSSHINMLIRITPLGANKVGNDTTYPGALSLNAIIDSSSFTWKNNANQNLFQTFWLYVQQHGVYHWVQAHNGNWNGASNKYIPLQLDVSSQKYYGWVRLDVPTGAVSFTVKDYAYNSSPNQFILAGQSNNAPLALLASTTFCAGDSIAIPLITYATFNANNYFISQLSDSVGSFNNPVVLDSIQSNHADTIHTIIPTGTYPSINYKIRILSTDTALQGTPTNQFTINESPMALLANLGDTVCPGAALNLNNSGPCLGCSYQWKFNGSNIPNGTGSTILIDSSGIYNVVVTNLCGVSNSNIDTFLVMPVINITIPDSMSVCVANLPLQLNVASPTGGTYQGFGITSPDLFNGTFIGSYTIHYKISDSFGCQFISQAMQIQVNTCTAVSEISNNNAIEIYPNPASTHITIALGNNSKKVEVTITDISGKAIYTNIATDTQKIEVSTKDLAAGIYVVQIQSADLIGTKKLVIEK